MYALGLLYHCGEEVSIHGREARFNDRAGCKHIILSWAVMLTSLVSLEAVVFLVLLNPFVDIVVDI